MPLVECNLLKLEEKTQKVMVYFLSIRISIQRFKESDPTLEIFQVLDIWSVCVETMVF